MAKAPDKSESDKAYIDGQLVRLSGLHQSNPGKDIRYITYIRTHEGWFYLAVVLDLFSRKTVCA